MAFVTTFEGFDYFVYGIEYANPENPEDPSKNSWVIGIHLLGYPDYQRNIIKRPLTRAEEERGRRRWLTESNTPSLARNHTYLGGTGINIPLAEKTWELAGGDEAMQRRFDDFESGNVGALDGLVVIDNMMVGLGNQ
jgi:hypothetical protein